MTLSTECSSWRRILVLSLVLLALMVTSLEAARGQLELRAVDGETGEPTAIRISLRNAKGRPILAPKCPRVGDDFVFDATVVLNLSPGLYTFVADKGPEYRQRAGHFEIQSGATDNHVIGMQRYVDMPQEGWWSGDLHVERPLRELPTLMLASDLYFSNVITWTNGRNNWQPTAAPSETTQYVGRQRAFQVMGGRDRRAGSEVIFGQLTQPLRLADDLREYPGPFQTLRAAGEPNSRHVHLSRMDARDLPVWLASGQVDSLGLLHAGLLTEGSFDDTITKPRDSVLFPDPHGVGRWSQQIYFRLLDAGLRIPPAAGSGAGTNSNPPGYNRVYVHCGDQFTPDAWWEGLRAGRVLVTNGPLLRPRVNGQLPGHVFHAAGERLNLEVEALLGTREKIDYLEVIKNGRSEMQVRLEDWAAKAGRLPPVTFEASGWMMVRVVTRNEQTYRCACSGPFYVSFHDELRVSRHAAQFFVDWVYQRAAELKLQDQQQQAEVMRYHRAARDFWKRRLASANSE